MVLLWDIGLIILTSTFAAFIARIIKQPLILAYVVAGIFLGPYGMQLITQQDIIKTLGELGIAFLIFMVGLELDVGRLKDVGKVSAGCGLGQIVITAVFGFLIAVLLGFNRLESIYIALALTISSTMIVVKLLSDKEELDTLHGKIVLGTLLIQDLVTITALAIFTTLDSFSFASVITAVMTALGLVAVAIISGRYVLPNVVRFAARSVELLFLSALSWFFIFTAFSQWVFTSLLDPSVSALSIGAFLSGVSLASLPYNLEIVGRIRSLKDFFVTIFFVSLGMQVPLQIPLITKMIVFSVFVLIGIPIIMVVICGLFGYGKRTSLLTGLSLAQTSEFSLILATQGVVFGHINQNIFSLVTWITLVTSTVSSYYILHSAEIYNKFLPFLKKLHRFSRNKGLEDLPPDSNQHTIVFGCDRMGGVIVKTLQGIKQDFLVVDLNPEIIKSLMGQRISAIYGDIGDIEVLERINLHSTRIVISTIPNINENLLILKETRKRNPDCIVISTSKTLDDAMYLYNNGVDYVIMPHVLSGKKVSEFLLEYMHKKDEFLELKKQHISELENQKRLNILMRYEPSLMGIFEKRL